MKLSKSIAVLVLVLTMGLHWALLQSVAWVSMIIRYSQDDGFTVALVKTFDGQHPCTLCKVIQQAKSEEDKQPTGWAPDQVRYDWICQRPGMIYVPGPPFRPPAMDANRRIEGWLARPPTPPPRFLRGV